MTTPADGAHITPDGADIHGANRREFLQGLVAAGIGLPGVLGFSGAAWAQQPAAPSNVRVTTRRTLTIDDFEWLGLFRVPTAVRGFGPGSLAARKVDGQLRFFMNGNKNLGFPVVEFTYPGVGATLATAPRAALVKDWGDVTSGKRVNILGSTTQMQNMGLAWHDNRLWWTYTDVYNTVGHHDPVVGCTVFNADGTYATYGPWKTQEHCHKTHSWIVPIPIWFGDAYCGGARWAFGGSMAAGNVSCSWGNALYASQLVPTIDTPALTSMPTLPLVGFSYNTRQPRPGDYINHAGNPDYPPSGGLGTWTQIDNIFSGSCAWIDLPDMHGVLFTGYQGFGHVWYGGQTCAHGITDPGPMAQGPHAESYRPYWWMWNPFDLADVATGLRNQSAIQPSFELNPLTRFPSMVVPGIQPGLNGLYFDPDTRLLYMSVINIDKSWSPYEALPIVHVFRIL